MDKIGVILDGKYEIIRVLGEGGMGRVYLCRNMRLDALFAVKEFKKQGSVDFISEPNILKQLRHPGIPVIIDIFDEERYSYMVEEYIEGNTLDKYVSSNYPLSQKEICRIALEIGDIIEYLHSFNPPIIYRDLKPSNIIINNQGKVVLIDFGISRRYKEGADSDTIYMGSAGYAAPEQLGSGQSCRQTDIYGLGAVMFFMVNNKAASALLESMFRENYSSLYRSELVDVVMKAMEIDINKRFLTIEHMKEAVLSVLQEDYNNASENINVPLDDLTKTMVTEPKVKESRQNIKGVKKLILASLAMVVIFSGYLAWNLGKDNVKIVKTDLPKKNVSPIKSSDEGKSLQEQRQEESDMIQEPEIKSVSQSGMEKNKESDISDEELDNLNKELFEKLDELINVNYDTNNYGEKQKGKNKIKK